MITNDPPWELVRTFLDVLRDGSQSAAARRLGLTQPTVGRQIDALEARLGLSLFTRSPRGLLPTPAALQLLPHAEAMESAAAALARAASGEAAEDRGVVRVTASEIMGCEALPPILARFRRAHPGVVLELALTNRQQDLLRRDADIAVRMARPTQNALIARKIGVTQIGLFAHRSYIEAFGAPQTLDDLRDHGLIGFDRDDRSFRSVGPMADAITRDMFIFRTDHDAAQLAALRAGVGIGGCQLQIAAGSPELTPVLPDVVRFSLEVWLAMHEDLKATRRVRLLFDALAEGLLEFLRGGDDV